MKTIELKTLVGSSVLGISLWIAPAWGQRPCLPGPRQWLEVPDAAYSCEWTPEWIRPVDLDGDRVADFSHERFRAVAHYGDPMWDPNRPPDAPVAYYHQDDTIEAYYPAGHVDLYWLIWGPTFGDPEPRLTAGHQLLPEPVAMSPGRYGSWGLPEPARNWIYPRLEAEGLGIILRKLEMAPCVIVQPPDDWCAPVNYVGYMYRDPDPWWVDPESDHYFGFRLRRADGWHLGWLRLHWKLVRGGPEPAPLELVSWAAQPEPETAIVVGEPARPTLRAAREGHDLVLRRSPVWTNAVLEGTASLSAPVWEPVPGVTNATARLPAAGPLGFFRLRTP